jgi:hypothetical protein
MMRQNQLIASQQAAQRAAERFPLSQKLLESQIALTDRRGRATPTTQILPGAAGEAQGIQILIDKYGKNSPIVERALRSFNIKLKAAQQRGDYYGANVKYKYLTPTMKNIKGINNLGKTGNITQKKLANKTIEHLHNLGIITKNPDDTITKNPTIQTPIKETGTPLANGNMKIEAGPTTTITLTPQQQQDMLMGDQSKRVSDSITRQRALASGELLATFNKINLQPIADYAGPEGATLFKKDAAMANIPGSKPPQRYIDYLNFKKSQSKLLADQVRAALKTSVRYQYVQHYLLPLADPNLKIWGNNPYAAIQRMIFFRDWLKNYHDFYLKASQYGVSAAGRYSPPPIPSQAKTIAKYGSPAQKKEMVGQAPTSFYSKRFGRNFTLEDLKTTAKANNKTLAQIKQDFGVE